MDEERTTQEKSEQDNKEEVIITFLIIARLRKAEYLESLRQIFPLSPSPSLRTDGVGGGLAFGILSPLYRHCEAWESSRRGAYPCFVSLSSIVIARLGKAEAIRYNF